MEPLGTEWVEELKDQIEGHIEYFPLHVRMKELEPQVEKVLRGMVPEQRKVITDYIRLLLKVEVCLSKHAYLAGLQTAKRREGK